MTNLIKLHHLKNITVFDDDKSPSQPNKCHACQHIIEALDMPSAWLIKNHQSQKSHPSIDAWLVFHMEQIIKTA